VLSRITRKIDFLFGYVDELSEGKDNKMKLESGNK